MYAFRDTTTRTALTADLPAEAVKINGTYIENQITGYRTLHVAGREMLSAEADTYETGIRDGAALKSRRYPARTITVTYQLVTGSNAAFREAYNQLAKILNVQDAEIIFADEADKYFTGTVTEVGEVDPGRNAVVSTYTILCTDPFKYSTAEKTVSPASGPGISFTVNYAGTYPAAPTLEAQFHSEEETSGDTTTALTGKGDCGYIAMYNQDGEIIQLGDPDEIDGTELAKSQTLISQTFTKSNSWGTAAKKAWTVNGGVTSSDSFTQSGALTVKSVNAGSETSYYLTPSSYGSGSQYHGPSISRNIPADASGKTGAVNCAVSWKQLFCTGERSSAANQYGAFQLLLSGSDGKYIAGISIFKNTSGNTGRLRFYCNGKTAETLTDVNMSYYNQRWGHDYMTKNGKKVFKAAVRTSSIIKDGDTLNYNIGGTKRTFRDAALKDKEVTKITIMMCGVSTKTALENNGLFWVKFVKNNCDTWDDVPNKFSAGDIVTADCGTGEILLNGSPAPDLGALGNSWEGFRLEPGENQIDVSYSDWIEEAYKPTCKLKYREVYL